MSQPVVSPPPGRGWPRWSVFRRLPEKSRQPAGLPASSAGLPFCSAMGCVAPPLLCSAPSLAFFPLRSPSPLKLHVLSLLKLYPSDVMVPAQFPPFPLFATILFWIRNELPALLRTPPPPIFSGLVPKVELLIWTVPPML